MPFFHMKKGIFPKLNSRVSKYIMDSLWIHNIFFMLLMYYNIKVKSLCVWGSQNLSSDKYVPRYLIHQRLSVKRK